MATKTGTPMCPKCVKTMKENKDWYQCSYYIVAGDSGDCLTHPVITNPRVVRTLKTLRAWSLDPAGTKMTVGSPTYGMNKVVMHTGGGHIHERNAYLSLFDYERPFVDLLVELGYVSRHKGTRSIEETTPTTLTVNKSGDELIRQSLLLAEVRNDKSPLTP